MRLYNLKAGMNPRRVRIFLAEKDIQIPTVDIDMMKGENRTPEFLAMNPLGKLPVLELDDGAFISESIAICRYLEELHPAPNLFGSTPTERAIVEMWNRRMDLELVQPMSEQFVHLSSFFAGRVEQIAKVGAHARQHAMRTLQWLDAELAQRPYIASSRYTVADISAQCAMVLGKNTGVPLPEDLPNLGRWWADVSSRPTARA
ncbi:Glutathione S-transferase [uncultured Defluviicoccus sp.]|uniref:Glutathione S-transferase n=1 Tax=metagenome TaxID=256318 RepID=A0A380T800_9ZZZZ|nr:Glutathione S-transferase [uncultured Defluviicoccus sp.]